MSPVFTEKVKVRFNDCDFYQHVNNAVYLNYMDNAMIDFFRSLLGNFNRPNFRMHLVRVEIDYKNPATFDDELLITTQIAKIGNTSITFAQTIKMEKTGLLLVECKKVGVFLDAQGKNKMAVPDILLPFAP